MGIQVHEKEILDISRQITIQHIGSHSVPQEAMLSLLLAALLALLSALPALLASLHTLT